MKDIWVVSVHDQWKGTSWVSGVFSSWELAVTYARKKYPKHNHRSTDAIHSYDADIERFVVDERVCVKT
jgi:hypothetical protein